MTQATSSEPISMDVPAQRSFVPVQPSEPVVPTELYLDMDGVLVDFVRGALQVHDRIDLLDNWPIGNDVDTALGLDKYDFWLPIDKKASFWESLAPYPWLPELLNVARSYFSEWHILTKPHNYSMCYSGKYLWCVNHLPADTDIITCKKKFKLAAPSRLLIDDNEGMVKDWRASGGHAILFPRPWNSLHAQSCMPMVYVGMELARILNPRQAA